MTQRAFCPLNFHTQTSYFRLKRLQVIDILTKRGVFFAKNLQIPNDKFLDVLLELEKNFFQNLYSGLFWKGEDNVNLTEIMTELGFCYSFNIVKSSDLLNIQSTSNDFHYKFIDSSMSIKGVFEDEGEKKVLSSQLGLMGTTIWNTISKDWRPVDDIANFEIDGILLLLHDPFELPSSNSIKIPVIANRSIQIWIEPEIHGVDESIVDFSSKELSF